MLLDKMNEHAQTRFLAAVGVKNQHATPNWPLPHMVEVTESDYWGHSTVWSWGGDIYVGHMRIDDEWFTLRLFWVDNAELLMGGYAVLIGHSGHWDSRTKSYPPRVVRYFKWRACEHEFTQKNLGRCYNEYRCKKCDEAYTVDSSD